MTMLYIFIALLLLATATFLVLITVTTQDSAGRKNNALLMYYLAVSLWAATALGGVTANVKMVYDSKGAISAPSNRGKKKLSVIRSRRSKVSGPDWAPLFNFVFYGMGIQAIVYVVRRPEWANLIIRGMGALKGKSIDTSVDALVHHAIYNKEDREWALDAIRAVKGTEKLEEDEPVIVNPDMGGLDGH